jgi:formylglycine-generating enzyme required for sulfatase activity
MPVLKRLLGPLPLLLVLCAGLVGALLLPDWPAGRVEVRTVPRSVITLPDGAAVRSPALLAVPAGGLRIRASARDYHPLDTVIRPRPGRATLNLRYAFPATVSSRPAGMRLLVDGRPRGLTPAEVSLPGPGRVALLLEDTSSGISVADTVQLLENRPRELSYDMPTLAMEGGMVYVPGMVHTLSSGEDGGRNPVRLEGFYISRREVTVEDICRFLNDADPQLLRDTTCRQGYTLLTDSLFPADWDPGFRADTARCLYHPRKGMEGHPAACISLRGARAYCAWLEDSLRDEVPGIRVGLPTPSQWEAAARAGRSCRYPWGPASPSGSLANISDASEPLLTRSPGTDDGHPGPAPAGSYPPNPWGLWDMAGNLAEWCVAEDGTVMAMGGSWLADGAGCRCGARTLPDTTLGYPHIGFRVVAQPGI